VAQSFGDQIGFAAFRRQNLECDDTLRLGSRSTQHAAHSFGNSHFFNLQTGKQRLQLTRCKETRPGCGSCCSPCRLAGFSNQMGLSLATSFSGKN
jgi:hypothetical protein